MKNFKKLSMYDENIKTTASNSTDPLLGLDNVSKRFSIRSFIVGIGCGMVLGLMLALIIINFC